MAEIPTTRQQIPVAVELPTHDQCEAKVKIGEASALEKFIYNNEPAGFADEYWRADLADVLAEAITEDRWSRLWSESECLPQSK